MQNLLQMNNLDMDEHQAGSEKEQIKQAKVGELLSNKQEIKEPQKQMKSVGVDATKELKNRVKVANSKAQIYIPKSSQIKFTS